MTTAFTPTIGSTIVVACASLVVQFPGLASPIDETWIPPEQQTEISQVVDCANVVDWEETHYLESIPGVGASIQKGLATPISELECVDLSEFGNFV